MGTSGAAPSCYNPFHSYNLGWTDPVTVLDNDVLAPGGRLGGGWVVVAQYLCLLSFMFQAHQALQASLFYLHSWDPLLHESCQQPYICRISPAKTQQHMSMWHVHMWHMSAAGSMHAGRHNMSRKDGKQ
jgi:hypothetical protein